MKNQLHFSIVYSSNTNVKLWVTSDVEFTEIVPDTISFENLELNRDNFYFVCYYFGIEHPEIVYAQAELESARFTSKVFKENNNFLGLYNSKKKTSYFWLC